jgi:hypothetical protein
VDSVGLARAVLADRLGDDAVPAQLVLYLCYLLALRHGDADGERGTALLARLDLTTGTLIIFDRRPEAAPIHERTQLSEERTPSGRAITLLRA